MSVGAIENREQKKPEGVYLRAPLTLFNLTD